LRRLLLISLLALPLDADPIGDVRSALERLTGREPIRATYELQQNVAAEGKFGNDKFNGKVAVELEGDANGVRIVFSRPLLDTLDREQTARARNPNLDTPTVSAVREVDPVGTAEAIDFAPSLGRLLDGAKLVSDTTSTWQGKPARALVVRVTDRVDSEDAGKVKILENKLTLWLGTDHVPLAAEHLTHAKFSLLFLKAEVKERKSWHLTRVADRLVCHRFENHHTSSGMGQKGNETIVATLRVH
jgi:hypothetical protein